MTNPSSGTVTVWFDGNSVVDEHVAVFGPLGVELHAGQKVLADMEGKALYEAIVTLATPMEVRCLATVRLVGKVEQPGGDAQ